MKKFIQFVIEPSFLGKKITGKVGVIPLTEDTSQKDLRKLFKAGFTNVVKAIEIKDEPKEDK
tara:strand:- start:404 stop:589 length:186 start_codon:yes stop_codon:yes gene_type:complete